MGECVKAHYNSDRYHQLCWPVHITNSVPAECNVMQVQRHNKLYGARLPLPAMKLWCQVITSQILHRVGWGTWLGDQCQCNEMQLWCLVTATSNAGRAMRTPKCVRQAVKLLRVLWVLWYFWFFCDWRQSWVQILDSVSWSSLELCRNDHQYEQSFT